MLALQQRALTYPLLTVYLEHTADDGRRLRVSAAFSSADERRVVVEGMRRCYPGRTVTEAAADEHGTCEIHVGEPLAVPVRAIYEGEG